MGPNRLITARTRYSLNRADSWQRGQPRLEPWYPFFSAPPGQSPAPWPQGRVPNREAQIPSGPAVGCPAWKPTAAPSAQSPPRSPCGSPPRAVPLPPLVRTLISPRPCCTSVPIQVRFFLRFSRSVLVPIFPPTFETLTPTAHGGQ